MRIAIDIDSTLHNHWDLVSRISRQRFGVELPYEEQLQWGVTRLRPEQFELCVREAHSERCILDGVPYPGAVKTVRAWHAAGHFVHVTSQRDSSCYTPTARWLSEIGLPFDDLHCSPQKIARAVELDIELLIDDSPANLLAAIQNGMLAATISHPWNRELCEEEDIICARSWAELEGLLQRVMGAKTRSLAG
ncbi:MAG: 5' nucleotidase, NT5C type [Solirubrobacteraceae bacterium]